MSVRLEPIQVSIVIPLFNEEGNVEEVYYRIKETLIFLKKTYEIILVNDGSRDRTYDIIRDIQNKDVHIKIIKLAKNYGQLYAILAGFEFVKGEIIIVIDGDLQIDPCDISQLLIKIDEGFDLVSGWRYKRKDPAVRRLISYLANWLMGLRTGIKLHDYGCALIATKKQIINRLKDYGSGARFIKPLIARLSDSISEVKVKHYPRKSGVSKYSFLKIIKSGLDFLFSFTTEPKRRDKSPYVIEEVIGN